MMKKPIELIDKNPFRDFDIYPVGETQVMKLLDSFGELGMWAGLPARKVGDRYQIACGHHRLEAARRNAMDKIDLAVLPYTDSEMVAIMVTENMTQRGHENFGAVLDSVSSTITMILRECFHPESFQGNIQGSTNRQKVESGKGIGHETVNNHQPSISEGAARVAIAALRATDHYNKLFQADFVPDKVKAKYMDTIPPITTIPAVGVFNKPVQVSAWVDMCSQPNFKESVPLENHESLAYTLRNSSAPDIRSSITGKLGHATGKKVNEYTELKLREDIEQLKRKVDKFINNNPNNEYHASIWIAVDELNETLNELRLNKKQELINV